MGDFASRGVGGAALGTGIAGLTLGVLNSGAGLMGGFGRSGWGNGWGNGWNACGNWGGNGWGWNGAGAAFDMSVSEALAERDARIAQLEANRYSDASDLVLYKYVDEKFKAINDKFTEQAVINATTTNGLSVLGSQFVALQNVVNGITQTVVPKNVVVNTNCHDGLSTT